MLSTQNYIIKNASLSKSQDFDALRQEGVGHITQLSSTLWTDYNLHDPGITILEALCYAITDLGFRTTHPMRDLLTSLDANGVPRNDSDFHTARPVLTNYPVTFDDLRKVLVDIKGVRMAWIRKNNEARYQLNRSNETLEDGLYNLPKIIDVPTYSSKECFLLRGLFDVYVEYEDSLVPKRVESVGMKTDVPTNFVLPSAGGEKSMLFEVKYDCVLESICVFPESKPNPNPLTGFESKNIVIRLMDETGATEIATITKLIEQNGKKQTIDLGFVLQTGKKYRLDAKGSDMKLGNNTPSAFPYKIEGVIELIKCQIGSADVGLYYFFYDWQINYAVLIDTPSVPITYWTQEDVLLTVKEKLHTYRNLCEDFVRICPMKQEQIGLCADIDLEPYAAIEDIEAEILYRLTNFISPPVHFYTLDEMRAKGKTVEEIFEGPALQHGFIDKDEFRQITRVCQLKLSDIFQIILGIEGVTAVRQVELVSYIDGQYGTPTSSADDKGTWVHPLSSSQFLAPVFTRERTKIFFYKNNLPYLANKIKTDYAFAEKKAQDIYSKLNGATATDLDMPVPIGKFRDLAAYESIQNDMPETYRVGRNRVAASATPLRKAQAQQLKGYLLHFDHILLNSMAQLAHLKDLFGWSNGDSNSYFSPPLPKNSISDMENLYTDLSNLTAQLTAIVESDGSRIERKGAFLDHLAARFAENLTEYTQLMRTLYAETEQQLEIIGDKKRLLARYPEASAQRLKAFDYSLFKSLAVEETAADAQRAITGFQKRAYALLGFDKWYQQELSGHLLSIESVDVLDIVTNINVKKYCFVLRETSATNSTHLFDSILCPNRQDIEALLDDALEIGSDADNFNKTTLALEQDCNGNKNAIGHLSNLSDLQRVVDYFKKYANIEGFHVVEHLLLRKRTKSDPFLPIQVHKTNTVVKTLTNVVTQSIPMATDEPCDCPEVTDPYSFRISVYLPSWSKRFKKIRFRQHVEKVLREECPAHIFPKICWISHEQMVDFEIKYENWLKILNQLPKGACCLNETGKADSDCNNHQRGGLDPLPITDTNKTIAKPNEPNTVDENYRDALHNLIELMNDMDNVFPTARLHSCEETDGDNPEITLDNTSLGTL